MTKTTPEKPTKNREDTFSVGSVVNLKSGGPSMTVEAVAPEGYICVWFTGGVLRRETFLSLLLESRDPLGLDWGKT